MTAAAIAEHQIPRRRWLHGQHLARGFVSATVSPGGVGKSTLVFADHVALAVGERLLWDTPVELVPSVHGYIHFLRERVGVNKPATGETEAHHKLRLTKARADMAELESAEMTGDLVLLEKAEAAWTSAIGRMRQRLLAMPSKLAPVAYQAGAVAEVKAALADGIAEALMELSKVEARAVDNRGSDETGGSDDESVPDARPAAGRVDG